MTNYLDILRTRKQELSENLLSLKESAQPVDLNDPIGRLSRMDAIQHQQITLNNKRQIELNLKQVDQAMIRLKNDEYGICLSCEDEIEEKRLLAKPEAPFCIKCEGLKKS